MSENCTIQDVFNRFYPDYEKTHELSAAQQKAVYHIMNCKTGAFGVNVSVCEDCGCISVHYNSCRDRCCPMCQEFPREKWVDARREDILDAPYFHVVFTVPEELNPVIYSNQKLLYKALYHAASDTLSELARDKKYLGADIGYICILHTWGSAMNFHPHIHTIVLGGGLDAKNHWKDNGEDFFLPVKVLSRVFRGKYLAGLKQLWADGKLEFYGTAEPYKNHYAFKQLLDACYAKEWIPYCKKPFRGAESVIKYLGKYTHRIAISNYRIKGMTDSTVTFAVKDYKNHGQWKELTLSGEECMFLPSVLCGSGITVCFLPGIKTGRLHYAATCLAVRDTFPGLRILMRPPLSSCSITRMSANAHPAEGTSFPCHLAGIT